MYVKMGYATMRSAMKVLQCAAFMMAFISLLSKLAGELCVNLPHLRPRFLQLLTNMVKFL